MTSATNAPHAQPLADQDRPSCPECGKPRQGIDHTVCGYKADPRRISPANGQTVGERKIDIDRLEAVLQGMIVMLRDNPDVPIPWAVDICCKTTEAGYERFLERHGIASLSSAEWMAYLAPLAERYSCAEDRAGFYMPWSINIEPEDKPL